MGQFDYKELNRIYDRINGWIENCDSKVSTTLSGLGVFAGILLATDYISKFISICRFVFDNISICSVTYLIVTAIALCVLICGAVLLVCVLFARIDPKDYEERGVKKDSLIFFSAIVKNKNLSKYRAKLKKATCEQVNDDLVSQIYVCSLICDKKFTLYNKGLRLTFIGFFLLVVMLIVGVIIV